MANRYLELTKKGNVQLVTKHSGSSHRINGPFGHKSGLTVTTVMSVPARSVFQPREGDLCTWVDENKFFELDDEIQEEDFSLQDLLSGYKTVAATLHNASVHFAAIGGLAIAILGGRSATNMTHDIDLLFNGTVTQLFDTLRKTKGYVMNVEPIKLLLTLIEGCV